MFHHYLKKYLPEFVYGATDGTITTFAIISAVSGASLSTAVVLILGFSNVLADGFSMASSNYLSQQSASETQRVGKAPTKTAVATFVSFVFIGSIPLLPFALFYNTPSVNAFVISIVATLLTFLVIGYARGHVLGDHPVRTSLKTLLIGGVASAIAYTAGGLLETLI